MSKEWLAQQVVDLRATIAALEAAGVGEGAIQTYRRALVVMEAMWEGK